MSNWVQGLSLLLATGLGWEARATTSSLTMGLVGMDSTGQLKAEYYFLDGTYAGKAYLMNGGAAETYAFGGAEIVAGQDGISRIAVTDSNSSFISLYGLDGSRQESLVLSDAESTSFGLALGADSAGTTEWAVSRRHWGGNGWARAYDLAGNSTFSQLPCNEPGVGEIASADVTSAHAGNEVLWAEHYWQGGVALHIRDSRLNTYGTFKEGFHRYDTVYGDLHGGGVVTTIFGNLVSDHVGNEFGIVSKDASGNFWVNFYSADIADYGEWGTYTGPALDQIQLGTTSLDFVGTPGAGLINVPEPVTLAILAMGGLVVARKRM
jgi:hypothetical protein